MTPPPASDTVPRIDPSTDCAAPRLAAASTMAKASRPTHEETRRRRRAAPAPNCTSMASSSPVGRLPRAAQQPRGRWSRPGRADNQIFPLDALRPPCRQLRSRSNKATNASKRYIAQFLLLFDPQVKQYFPPADRRSIPSRFRALQLTRSPAPGRILFVVCPVVCIHPIAMSTRRRSRPSTGPQVSSRPVASPRPTGWRLAALAAAGALLASGVWWWVARSAAPGAPALARPNVLLVTIDTLRADHVGLLRRRRRPDAGARRPRGARRAVRGRRSRTRHSPGRRTPRSSPASRRSATASGTTPTTCCRSRVPTLPAALRRRRLPDRRVRVRLPAREALRVRPRLRGLRRSCSRAGATRGGRRTSSGRRDQTTSVALRVARSSGLHRRIRGSCGSTTTIPTRRTSRRPSTARRFAGRPYDGEVAFVDAQFGRVLRRIEALGLTGRTLVLVTADHGESLGEHGEATHGIFVYDVDAEGAVDRGRARRPRRAGRRRCSAGASTSRRRSSLTRTFRPPRRSRAARFGRRSTAGR